MNVTQWLITHTTGVWSLYPTLSSICIDTFWYARPSFTDIHLKDFHCKAQLYVHATLHFYT